MPFDLVINEGVLRLYEGDAANDVNTNTTEVQGSKIVDKTLNTDKILEVGNYTVDTNGLRSGSLLLESVTVDFDEYRYRVIEDAGEIIDIDDIYEGYESTGITDRVGNIINTFEVDGVNSFELYGRTGLGYFAGGKLRWDYVNPADPNEGFEVLVDGEIIARSGNIEGTLTMGASGLITGSDGGYTFNLTENGLEITATGSRTLVTRDFISIFNSVEGVELKSDSFQLIDASDIVRVRFDTFNDIYTIKKLTISDTTDATSKDTGAIITEGGLGVEKSAYIGANLRVLGTTEAFSTSTGAFIVDGGLAVKKNLHIGGVLVAPIVDTAPIEIPDSPYTITTTSHIAVDSTGGAIVVNLPTGVQGRRIVVFDALGQSATNNITINRASTDTINGATSYTLNTNYQSVTLIFYSGNWTII